MSEEKFQKEYIDFVKKHEGEKLKIYDDGTGVPTVGVGFALMNKIGKEWVAYPEEKLNELGIKLNNAEYKIILEYAETKNKHSKAKDSKQSTESFQKQFESLKRELDSISFRIDSKVSNDLLQHSINDKLNIIKSTIGKSTWNNLNDAQKIGVMDHCFHKGGIKDIKEHIQSGNFDKASHIMRKTNTDSLKARHDLRADFVKHGKMEFDGVHIVKPGENFRGIEIYHNLKEGALKVLNPEIKNYDKLSVGQKIIISDQAISNSNVGNDRDAFIKKELGSSTESSEFKSNNITDNFNLQGENTTLTGEQEIDGGFRNTSIHDVMDKIWAFNTSMLTTSIDRSMQEISAWMTESLKRVDPLVLIFGEVENSMISINSGVMFDIDGDGKKDRTGWLTPKNGFLILDKNQNGVVDGISELFGDENISGFVELAKYDENKDNVIDSKDSIWSKIKLWRDLNTDGISDIRVLSFLTINYGFALA